MVKWIGTKLDELQKDSLKEKALIIMTPSLQLQKWLPSEHFKSGSFKWINLSQMDVNNVFLQGDLVEYITLNFLLASRRGEKIKYVS